VEPVRLRLPLLGSTANHVVFQYLLLEITPRSALIAIPHWLLQRSHLQKDEQVHLFLDSRSAAERYCEQYLVGHAEPLPSTSSELGQLYSIHFEEPVPSLQFPKRAESDEVAKIAALLKDSLLLKNGVSVYLKHAIPFFSRILKISAEHYERLKSVVLSDIESRVHTHLKELERLYKEFIAEVKTPADVSKVLDLEYLRELTESEIDINLLDLAFLGNIDLINRSLYHTSVKSYGAYVNAIKTLEQRLYANYNSIVTIYGSSVHVSQ
jgi:hypothetical protein